TAHPWGILKILDMGLARIEDDSGEGGSNLTQLGVVMGTPDFISPEQARNASATDIRSDLYSLGCTFYYLLTGRTPFPTGTLTEKLLHHQLDPPTPMAELRPGIPATVEEVVSKLMSKRPEDRYQTPSEFLQALNGINDRKSPPANAIKKSTPPAP